MTVDEPYRDPDGPIHAVLAAANTIAPRCHLPDGVSLVHARYQYPACVPESKDSFTRPKPPEALFDDDAHEVGAILWTGPSESEFIPNWMGGLLEARRRYSALLASVARRRADVQPTELDLDAAKRRTRRDVAGVIT